MRNVEQAGSLESSVEPRDSLSECLDVFPDLFVLPVGVVARLVVIARERIGIVGGDRALREQSQVRLQIAKRAGEVLQVIGEKARSRSSTIADGSTVRSRPEMKRAWGRTASGRRAA